METFKSSQNKMPVLGLQGRFDMHEVDPANAWLMEQVTIGITRLIVDLSGVNFIDSTAPSSLVRGLKYCREKGGDPHVCTLQIPVRVVFDLTRLDRVFGNFSNGEEAAKGF
jgi:anti-sigma B factor antagonist